MPELGHGADGCQVVAGGAELPPLGRRRTFTPKGGHLAYGNPSGFIPNPNPPTAGMPTVPAVTFTGPAMVESPAQSGNFVASKVGPATGTQVLASSCTDRPR